MVADIADIGKIFCLADFTGGVTLHHNGDIAEDLLEARSTIATRGTTHRSVSTVKFADFVSVADKVGNS